MPPTRISGVEIRDGSIQRADLDTTTIGQSVLTSLAISGDFELAHTGADIGTGDVTISLKPTGVVAGQYTKVTYDENGRAVAGTGLSVEDIPSGVGSYIQNQSDAAQTASLWINGFLGGSDFRAYNAAGTQYVGFSAPAILSGSYTFKLPGSYGASGQVMVGDGAGGLSWVDVPEGTVTSVALSVPSIFTVTGSPVTGSGTLSFDWNGSSTNLVRADGSTIASSTFEPALTAGTSAQYFRGDKSLATFPTSMAPSGAASGDLSGTYPGPSVVGLRGAALPALGGSALLRYTGTDWAWDAAAYLTANQNITLSGDASGSGTTAITVTLGNTAVTGQLLTDFAVGTNTTVTATDSILVSFGKVQGQLNNRQPLSVNLTSIAALSGASTGLVKLTNGVASLDATAYLTENQTVTISGDVSGSGTTAITASIAASTVTGKALTGYVVGTNTALAATDTILAAFQKLQGQVTARLSANQTITLSGDVSGSGTTAITASITAATVTGKALTGYTVGTNAVLAATDTVLAAFGKLQAQITATLGTVTSVSLSAPSLFTVSGSPVSTSGTLTFAWNGASTNLVRADGSVVAAATYLTANQSITLSGDASGSGTTAITVAISAATVTGKALTGYVVGTNTALAAADTILGAFQKVQGQINNLQPLNANLTSMASLSTSTTGLVKLTNGIASLDSSAYLTANQSITLSGDASGSGTTAITVAISAATVTGKALTGYTLGTDAALAATDTVLAAFGKIQAQLNNGQPLNANLTSIASLATNATGLVKLTNGVASLDSSAYITANQTITLSGGASGSGTTAITVTLSNTAVTGQALTGYAVGTNTALAATDTILGAFQKVQGQINNRQALNANLTSIASLSTASTGLIKLTNGVASLDSSVYLTANQSITLSGDVAGAGATAITATIQAGAVTLAKMANLAANSIIGNNTVSAATPIALSVAQVQTMLGVSGGPFLPLTAGSTKPLTGALYSGGTFTFIPEAPFNLVNSAVGALKTQLNLVNTGGTTGAGSAIDFFTYDQTGGTNPGLRIAAYDDNWSADLVIFTKIRGAATNALAERLRVASAGTTTITGGKTVLATSVAGYAALNIPHGATPTAPVNGDIWTDTTGLRVRINGVTETMPNVDGANTWASAQTFSGGIVGVTTNSNAAAGHVGQYLASAVAVGSALTCTTNVSLNIVSLSLTAGDWDVEGNVNFVANATNRTITSTVISLNTTSATLTTDGTECYGFLATANLNSRTFGLTHARTRISIAATTTVYLVARIVFSAGGTTAYGSISARRVR